MSEDEKNKGREGEMVVGRICSNVGYCYPNHCDFQRLTTTNTPDMGADYFLEGPPGFVDNVMIPIANGKEPTTSHIAQLESSHHKNYKKPEKTRIDRKTTNNKIGATTMKKFIQDCAKHPLCEKHVLMGGEDLTPKAKEIISSHPNTRYVNNKGIERLDTFFKGRAHLKEAQNKNCLINKENNESES